MTIKNKPNWWWSMYAIVGVSGVVALMVLFPGDAQQPSHGYSAQPIEVQETIIPALLDGDKEDFNALAERCAPFVHPRTLRALITTESSHNPFAIGVVGGHLERQPKNFYEAIATINELAEKGYNFSLGLAQVNRHNLEKYGQNYESILDACTNLQTGAAILKECYVRAVEKEPGEQQALRAALSCYYSGNFTRGFQREKHGGMNYVERVVAAAGNTSASAIRIIPEIDVSAKTAASPVPVMAENRRQRQRDADWAFFSDSEVAAESNDNP